MNDSVFLERFESGESNESDKRMKISTKNNLFNETVNLIKYRSIMETECFPEDKV